MALTSRCFNKVGNVCWSDDIFVFVNKIDINEGEGDNSIKRFNNKFLFHIRGTNRFAYKMRVLHKPLRPALDAERVEGKVELLGECKSTTADWLIKRIVEEQVGARDT